MIRLRRERPGDVSPIAENFLACCYALVGLSWLARAALKWAGASIDAAVTLPARRVTR